MNHAIQVSLPIEQIEALDKILREDPRTRSGYIGEAITEKMNREKV